MTTWADFPNVKTIPDDTDELMMRTPSGGPTNKNARITVPNFLNSANPANTTHATSQADLEAAFGTDLIIPAGESKFVYIDESFTLTKPFKKQAGSSLLLASHSITITLTYTGPGALIQMDGAVVGAITQIEDITLKGNFTNECFALEDSLFLIMKRAPTTEFARVGSLRGMIILWDESGPFTNLSGISYIDTPAISITTTGPNGVGVPPTTMFSFINESSARMDVVVENCIYTTDSTHEFLFIDPNSDQASSFKIRDSGVIATVPNSLFQKGVNEEVTAVADNGSGKLRCTNVEHGQVNKTYAVLSGFAESTYNRTALITVIDNGTFDTEDIDFVPGADSGTINRSSLDSRDPRVIAEDNPEQRDSMFTAEASLESFDTPIQSSSLAPGAFEVITSVNWMFNKLERFEEGVSNEGQVKCKDLSTREYDIKYSGTIEKDGGSAGNIGIILLRNETEEVSFNPPQTINTGTIQISANDLIELSEDEDIQVAVKNYDTSSVVIKTSQVSLVISKG